MWEPLTYANNGEPTSDISSNKTYACQLLQAREKILLPKDAL